MMNLNKSKNSAWLFILICWLVYSVSYLGKVNYSANINQIIDFYGVTKAEAGIVPTYFFFAYGIGQLVNGVLCKRYNIKWTVFLSLLSSAIINLMIALSGDFTIIKWLWCANGFALSVLWPTLIRALAEALPQRFLAKSSLMMGTTVATGTLIIYALSAIFVAFGRFKLAFYTAATCILVVSVLWIIVFERMIETVKNERRNDNAEAEKHLDNQGKTDKAQPKKKLFLFSTGILCFCAIGVNLIKDGLTIWVPTILKEEYFLNDSLSILLTLLMPVVAIFANAFALKMHEKVPDYITHCAVIFAIIIAFIGMIIGSLSLKLVGMMILGLLTVNFLASSLNSLITSIFPMFMRGHINSGMFAGVLNAFCYIGSAISSYCLGVVADNYGWTAVFWLLIVFCLLVCIVWGVYVAVKHIAAKKSIQE